MILYDDILCRLLFFSSLFFHFLPIVFFINLCYIYIDERLVFFMLTKKDDFYKDLNLSGNLNDIEIDLDGDCENLEDFLKKDIDDENKNDKE